MKPLLRLDSVKMMHQLNFDNQDFMVQFPTINVLNSHKIFDSFNFTPLQITQMCLMLKNGSKLDQIYHQNIKE